MRKNFATKSVKVFAKSEHSFSETDVVEERQSVVVVKELIPDARKAAPAHDRRKNGNAAHIPVELRTNSSVSARQTFGTKPSLGSSSRTPYISPSPIMRTALPSTSTSATRSATAAMPLTGQYPSRNSTTNAGGCATPVITATKKLYGTEMVNSNGIQIRTSSANVSGRESDPGSSFKSTNQSLSEALLSKLNQAF